ncbi:MAG: DUF924 domain-containing protein [Labilithrix sp.]|nr:DUF924 domain-containing protein [Labilithrix sp.]
MTPEDIVAFWLGPPGDPPLANAKKWWMKSEAFDREIRERFEETLERAVRGELAAWRESPRGRLALVILLDQFSRNMFRGTPRSFAQDPLAREIAEEAFAAGDDRVLGPIETSFLLMPFMHAEDVVLQRRCVEEFSRRALDHQHEIRENFESSAKFARLHCEIVERFGRFPHRNEILGRASTHEETEFLKQPGSSF